MPKPLSLSKSVCVERIHSFVESVVSDDLHAKRFLSLANGVVSVIHSASLAVATIGRALGRAQGVHPKHAIKQVDRMLSNAGIDLSDIFEKLVPYVVASRTEIVVALDWTDFERDGRSVPPPIVGTPSWVNTTAVNTRNDGENVTIVRNVGE